MKSTSITSCCRENQSWKWNFDVKLNGFFFSRSRLNRGDGDAKNSTRRRKWLMSTVYMWEYFCTRDVITAFLRIGKSSSECWFWNCAKIDLSIVRYLFCISRHSSRDAESKINCNRLPNFCRLWNPPRYCQHRQRYFSGADIWRILTLTWGLTRYKSGLALSLSLSSICLRISSLLRLLRILTSSLDNGAVAVSWIGCATSGSDFFRWSGIAAAGIACTEKINEKQKERDGPRTRIIIDTIYIYIFKVVYTYVSNG